MKNKKKLIIALAMLLLSGAALTTATYAWFTANTRLQLGEIDVNVEATNGIQVSTDAITWKSSLTTQELREAAYEGSTNQFADHVAEAGSPTYFQPVSTDGSVTAGRFNMFFGTLQEDGSISLTAETDGAGTCSNATYTTQYACQQAEETWTPTNKKYIAFDLFISATETREVGLLSTSAASVRAAGQDAGLKQSTRVGFIDNGVNAANNPVQARLLSAGSSYTIWEPNADVHTTASLGVATYVYGYRGVNSICTNCVIDNATNFTAMPGGTNGNMLLTNASGANYVLNPASYGAAFPTTNTWDSDNYPTVFSVEAGINKIRVYIWVEGQDIDCENNATLGDAVTVKINLNAKPVI